MVFSIFYCSYSTWFLQSRLDYSLFTKGTGNNFVALLIFDDIIITGPSVAVIASLKAFLHSQFELKDLGRLRYFLGLVIAQSSKGIFFLLKALYFTNLKMLGFWLVTYFCVNYT